MSLVNNQTVVYGHDHYEYEEAPAAAGTSIAAGDVLQRNEEGEVEEHTGGRVGPGDFLVAFEPRRKGGELNETDAGVADGYVYSEGEQVSYGRVRGGSYHLRLTSGEVAVVGDELVVDGDNPGQVRLLDQDGTAPDDSDAAILARADQDVDTTVTGGVTFVPVLPVS